ncbi:carbohydrate kinase family protein [Streptomyces xinghaiensis]|uniref:carbohydrate kinase family protein n=1 Tax=Streptomyces xinghaiensis TaxID=1038928 RepID=UPI0034206D89
MRIAVAGSIATDHLMTFPGTFAEHLLPEELDKISLSFLVDELDVRRGGVAANIALGLGRLGLSPVLVGAVGADFADYGVWLKENGVDIDSVRVSSTRQTARFVCLTDGDANQIASFYAGAMADARHIDITEVVARMGGADLVLVSPDDPVAMLRHARRCRRAGIPFAADPSQQLARLTDAEVRDFVTGAACLFTNAYEAALLLRRTGWSEREVLERVGTWVTTRGGDGATVTRAGEHPLHVPAVPVTETADPTGVGDAFRAGFLAGTAWDWPDERSAQLGCALASVVIGTVGTQEYELSAGELLGRVSRAYGAGAAHAMERALGGTG